MGQGKGDTGRYGPTRWGFCREPGQVQELIAAAAGPDLMARPGFIVKVNWFSPLPANYTGPVALDLLLAALPGPATVLESHSSGRTDGSRWLGPGKVVGPARDWLRRQEVEFLEKTGLRAVMDRRGATYMNLTEEVWAGRVVDPEAIRRAVAESGPGGTDRPIRHQELLGCVPQALYDRRDRCLFIDFARVKLPRPGTNDAYSLGLKNMFGLIPEPARSDYHSRLPRAILDCNRIYHALFKVVTVCEGLENVIYYHKGGRNRAPWGNYDILGGHPGLLVAGTNPLEVDTAAALLWEVDLGGRSLTREAARFFPPCREATAAAAREFGRRQGLSVG